MRSIGVVLAVVLCSSSAGGALAEPPEGKVASDPPTVIDGVRQDGAPAPAALTPSSVDFDAPELFSDSLPLQIYQTLRTEAVFLGTGVVLDVTSFEVTGTSKSTALAFNGRTAVNGDGTVPRIPEFIAFVQPNLSAFSPKQTVSLKVGSKRDEGEAVLLAAFDQSLQIVDYDFFTVTPQMQTLTVSSPTANIILVGIFGTTELQVLVVDDLVYN